MLQIKGRRSGLVTEVLVSVTGLLLSNKRYNRGLAVDRQALGLREASENSKVMRDNSQRASGTLRSPFNQVYS